MCMLPLGCYYKHEIIQWYDDTYKRMIHGRYVIT